MTALVRPYRVMVFDCAFHTNQKLYEIHLISSTTKLIFNYCQTMVNDFNLVE